MEGALSTWAHGSQAFSLALVRPLATLNNTIKLKFNLRIGFDTASSIALLALSAIAKRGADGSAIPSSHVVILPLLFTAGMSLVDSLDSILMLYSYSDFPEHSLALFERIPPRAVEPNREKTADQDEKKHEGLDAATMPALPSYTDGADGAKEIPIPAPAAAAEVDRRVVRDTVVKMNVMSGLSIILTLMSILVAFRCVPLPQHALCDAFNMPTADDPSFPGF
ncbi:hypothetical protein DXG03_004929 [Asterophora parasitica]|uniref:Nickel/cobalt efflux system n=1 Tax=Asterophora parasitica TaxID=117018 RepID=A0A9P7GJX1_9AGAR|nr:hypothetical protein DXG03_004929 [Asterophora parasitica]